MVTKSMLVVLIMGCVGVVQVTGQIIGCQPGIVDNITLTLDNWLLWEPPSDTSCTASFYYVYISHELGQSEYTYGVGGTSLYIHFLQICESYYFNIVAMSAMGGTGPQNVMLARMPFPLDADLTVGLFSVSPTGSGVHLEWQVQEEWRKCAERYRVTVLNTDTDDPTDLYVLTNSATISSLVPCTSYTFGVRAIYNLGTEGPFSSTRYTAPAAKMAAPTLQGVNLGRTTIDLTWQLDSYSLNRCAVSSLTIDASPSFRVTYPIADQTNRPPVSVRLTGLQPNTLYILNVTVVNTAGVSVPAIVAVQTLE